MDYDRSFEDNNLSDAGYLTLGMKFDPAIGDRGQNCNKTRPREYAPETLEKRR
jgi:hypothetical protein